MKPDDSTVDPLQLTQIRSHALRALQKAGAMGRFPTPVSDVLAAAKLVVEEHDGIESGLLAEIQKKVSGFGKALKSAWKKVLGVLDAGAQIVHIDKGVHLIKKVFLKLHEVGHALMPWQRDIYGAIEDCELTLSPEISEAFDREANCFACEVLFQLETFEKEAADYKFGVKVPLALSKKFGASVYSTIRRYVSTHHRCCVVLVLNPPEFVVGDGYASTLRRVIPSKLFDYYFEIEWSERFTPDDEIGKMIPLDNRKMSRPRTLILTDKNGTEHECVAEAFKHKYQVFIVIHEVTALTQTVVSMP